MTAETNNAHNHNNDEATINEANNAHACCDHDHEHEHTHEAEAQEAAGVSELETLQAELAEWKNKFYYLAAEQENMKRRFDKEKENLHKYGTERVMRDLLEVVDNFERIASAFQVGKDVDLNVVIKNFKIGVDMVMAQFVETLKRNGCEQVQAAGKKFDPNFHEAISEREVTDDAQVETVVDEMAKGYALNGRLLRPSKVIIGKKI